MDGPFLTPEINFFAETVSIRHHCYQHLGYESVYLFLASQPSKTHPANKNKFDHSSQRDEITDGIFFSLTSRRRRERTHKKNRLNERNDQTQVSNLF